MIRKLALALPLALAACGGQIALPPGMPTVPAIQAQQAWAASVPVGAVNDFYNSGLLLIRQACGGYFDTATIQNLKAQQAQSALNTLSTVTSAALGLGGVAGAPVAGVGVGFSAISQLLQSQQQNSLTGPDAAALATLIQAEQAALIAAEGKPVSASDALLALYDVYQPCSATGLMQARSQALYAAPNHLVVSPAASVPASFSARAGASFAPRPPYSVSVR